MFEFLKRPKRMTLNTKQPILNETPMMGKYRIKITRQFEDVLNTIDGIRYDKKMTSEEKYSIMLAGLYMVNMVSDELMTSQSFFGKDKQFKGLEQEIKKRLKEETPNYIG